MGDFTVILPFNHTNGTTADANEVMANFAALRDGHNNSLHGTTGHTHTGVNGDGPKLGPGSITLNTNYDWTGIHTFLCGNLRVKGAGAGTAGLCYENSAAVRTHTIPASSGNDIFATLLATQSLSAKTLISPVIADFTNAQHNHSNAAGGGVLTAYAQKAANETITGTWTFNSEVRFSGSNSKLRTATEGLLVRENAITSRARVSAANAMAATLELDFNISAVARNNAGTEDYQLTFDTALNNVYYSLISTSDATNADATGQDRLFSNTTQRLTTSCRVRIKEESGSDNWGGFDCITVGGLE